MNSNYPAGTWEADPRAPWNQPEEVEEMQEEIEIVTTIKNIGMDEIAFEELIESFEQIVRCIDCSLSSYGAEGLQCDAREAIGSFKVPSDGFCHLGVKE